MSLLDKASLIVTPNAYKTSKLYSVVPNTTLGDMNVVRATTATRVNSAGLIESVGVNVPRIDYTNGSCPSLLVEPQRTNLLTYSNDFSNGIWTKQAGTSIVPNNAISPDGLMNATKVISNGSNGIYEAPIAVSTTVNNTKSIYLKGVIGGETVLLLDPWQSINTTTCVLTTEWQRFTLSETQSGGEAGLWVKNIPSTGIYIYGAQLEQGSYATSYIPTVATSVTRNTDAISKTGISSLIGQTEGTIFFDGIVNNIQNFATNILNTNKDPLTISTFALGKINASNKFSFDFFLGTGTFAAINLLSSGTFANGTRTKVAIRYKSGDFAMYVNGTLQATSTSTYTANGSKSEIFLNDPTTYFFYQENVAYNSTQLYKTGLSNSELAQLTTI